MLSSFPTLARGKVCPKARSKGMTSTVRRTLRLSTEPASLGHSKTATIHNTLPLLRAMKYCTSKEEQEFDADVQRSTVNQQRLNTFIKDYEENPSIDEMAGEPFQIDPDKAFLPSVFDILNRGGVAHWNSDADVLAEESFWKMLYATNYPKLTITAPHVPADEEYYLPHSVVKVPLAEDCLGYPIMPGENLYSLQVMPTVEVEPGMLILKEIRGHPMYYDAIGIGQQTVDRDDGHMEHRDRYLRQIAKGLISAELRYQAGGPDAPATPPMKTVEEVLVITEEEEKLITLRQQMDYIDQIQILDDAKYDPEATPAFDPYTTHTFPRRSIEYYQHWDKVYLEQYGIQRPSNGVFSAKALVTLAQELDFDFNYLIDRNFSPTQSYLYLAEMVYYSRIKNIIDNESDFEKDKQTLRQILHLDDQEKVVPKSATGQYEVKLNPVVVSYHTLLERKEERFARALENFKTDFERPYATMYQEMKHKLLQPARKQKRRDKRLVRHFYKTAFLEESDTYDLHRRLLDIEGATLFNQTVDATLPVLPEDIFSGADSRVNQHFESLYQLDMRENRRFTPFEEIAIHTDSNYSIGYLNSQFRPLRFNDYTDPVRWKWDWHAPKHEVKKTITVDLMRLGVIPYQRPDAEEFLRQLIRDEFEHKGKDKDWKGGIQKLLPDDVVPRDPFSPITVPELSLPAKKKKPNPYRIRGFKYPDSPFVFYLVNRIAFDAVKQDRIAGKYLQRKAVLQIHVDDLDLPPAVKERFIKLAGDRYRTLKARYDHEKVIRVVSRSQWNQRMNVQNCIAIVRRMLTEAWKVDLNFVPYPTDYAMLPHQQIESELIIENLRKMDEDQYRPHFDPTQTENFHTFRMYRYPSPHRLARDTERTDEVLSQLNSV